jgi:hypothetical protein
MLAGLEHSVACQSNNLAELKALIVIVLHEMWLCCHYQRSYFFFVDLRKKAFSQDV